jgi:hypothetical protein
VSDSALGKALVNALKADFARHGASRIRRLRKQQPNDYLKLVASLLPQAFSAAMAQAPPPNENEFARELKYFAPSLRNITRRDLPERIRARTHEFDSCPRRLVCESYAAQ